MVGCVDSLPQAVASGGSLHCGGDNAFPLKLSEASSNSRPDSALRVMALGTQVWSSLNMAWSLYAGVSALCSHSVGLNQNTFPKTLSVG